MENKKKELNDEELDQVAGGFNKLQECEYFLVASGKSESGECKDCFYYHKSSGCSIPSKQK